MNHSLIAVALLALPLAARADLVATGSLGGLDSGCALGRVDRAAATTRLCLTCHDGSLGGSVHVALPGGRGMGADVHPVDVAYDAAAARNARLRPRYELSRRLALPDGKIGCVTCHDAASPEPMHTSLSMARSALCASCHAV